MVEKVGVYLRLSDEDRDKLNKTDDSNSIVNQRSMCLKYANKFNWSIVDIYSDDDFSGAGTFRPDFDRMIKDCESGKINLVLCKSQSRFSRDMGVIEYYLHNKFIEWGVRFVSIVDNADTNIESNKKSRQINGLINEWYLDDLSKNIRKSLKNKREDGLFMGSFASYGYERDEDGHKLIIDPVASLVVKKIFEMYKDGYGYYRICEYLNNNNIPTRAMYKKQNGSKFVCSNSDLKTGKWNADAISQILKNEVYIGNLVQGKSTYVSYKNHKKMKLSKSDWCRIENTHEAIIDMDTWNKVQSILGKHSKPTKTGKVHYFTKKVYCSCCGRAFLRNVYNVKNSTSGKREYMQCKGSKRYHICSNNKSIRMDNLEEILIDAINDLLNKYYDKCDLKKLYDIRCEQDTDNNDEFYSLQKEKEDLNKQIDNNKKYYRNLFEEKVKGVISEDMFQMMSKDYFNEIENMMKRTQIIDKQIDELKVEKKEKKNADDILKKYKHIKELNKIVLDEFIDKVYIGEYDKENKTRDIEIEWNFKF